MSLYAVITVRNSALAKQLKALAMDYADFADDFGRGIYPSVAFVAWRLSWSERSVQSNTKVLIKLGVLVDVGTHPKYKTNEYALVFEALPKRDPWQHNAVAGSAGRPNKKRGATFADEQKRGATNVENSDKRGATNVKRGARVAPYPTIQPTEERDLTNKRDKSRTRSKSSRDIWMDALCNAFSEHAKIPIPPTKTKAQKSSFGALWSAPLTELYNTIPDCDNKLERATGLIQHTIKIMRAADTTIVSPKSIKLTAIAEFGKRYANAQQTEQNDQELAETDDSLAAYLAS